MTYDRSIPTQAEIDLISRLLMETGRPLCEQAALMIARLELAYLSALATNSSAGLATKA